MKNLTNNTVAANITNKVQVKLGSGKRYSFYNIDSDKEYTEIQANKMPWNVLTILDEANDALKHFGMHEMTLTERLLDVQPELAVNEHGESSSLSILLRDFIKGNLVELTNPGASRSEYKKVKLTKLGKEFLTHNVLEAA